MLPENINNIIINTGNIINSKELKKKAMQSPSEEVCDSVSSAFQTYLETMDLPTNLDTVFCDSSTTSKVDNSIRKDLKISVKIFMENYSSVYLKTAISQAMKAVDEPIDSLILSLPAVSNDDKFDLSKMKPLWNELENFVHNRKIVTIGISDLDTEELAAFYNWTKIKPSVNQVNLESCCVMPTEMIAFAKENDIQLLTHNDPKVLIPKEMLHKVLERGVKNPDDWKINWIVRYSVVVKCRGIIQNKGYLFCATKS